MPFSEKILAFNYKHSLIDRGDKIIVGVSGGADSVALALFLNEIRPHFGLQLILAHFNHNLRANSDKDQRFVEKLAKDLNLKFITASWKNAKREAKGSIEEAARDKRIEFFLQIASKFKAHKVALAHTQNDLAETVLMRLLRGSGLQGLRGILPKKDLFGATFIRPLLSSTREEVESYLKAYGQNFRTDESNFELKFFRNKIRQKLIPWLNKEFKDNCVPVLANAAETIASDYDFCEEYSLNIFSQLNSSRSKVSVQFNLKKLEALHPSIRRMLLRLAVEKIKGNTRQLTSKHIKEIEDLVQFRPQLSIVSLPGKILAKKSNTSLMIFVS